MFDPPDDLWEIIPFSDFAEEDEFVDFVDRPSFVRFLRHFKLDRRVMAHLRGVLTPPYVVSGFSDDEVIETVAWKVAARHLALRRRIPLYTQDVVSSGGGGGGGGGGGSQQKKPASSQNAPKISTPLKDTPSGPRRSWFAITVVHEVDGAEKVVDGLTLHCQLPVLGKTSGVTSRKSPNIRFNDLAPGGTGDVLATSHDEVVWEVTADID